MKKKAKPDVFVARLTRGAVTSTLAASACLLPQPHTEVAPPPPTFHKAAFTDQAAFQKVGAHEATDRNVVYTLWQTPSEWDKRLERAFRKLARQEAARALSAQDSARLNRLNRWRDRLLCPQSPDEMLLQIRRDRLLARTEELLKDYVEFKKVAGKAGATT